MAVIQISKIQVRRGQELQTGIPQLDPGEFGWAQDTEHLYIGKRISEGAPDDQNSRILTENDLNYFELLVNSTLNTSTAIAAYEYRQGALASTTVTTIQKKLDSINPSLVDFGIDATTGTYVQIDVTLQNALNDLYADSDAQIRADRRRQLDLPAGLFYLSNTVNLPPYTRLSGAGAGLTKIKYTNSASSMFKTVDILGNNFEAGNMQLSTGSSRDIVIEGITFEFDSSLIGAKSLLSLDNVNHAVVQDCTFQTEFNPESTTTYGIVNYGIGIEIRGQGNTGIEKCRNISIERCEFNGLLCGVLATGTVVTPAIRNSTFSNLNQGVVFRSLDTLQGPTNGYIAYNRFTDILREAILAEENPNGLPGNHLSTQNHFARVGTNSLNEFTTATTNTAVISFLSSGNKTVDDYFARKIYANGLSSTTNFYYNPYVRGVASINDSSMFTATVVSAGTTEYYKIPFNNSNQSVSVNYQLYNDNQSRIGKITANVQSDGFVSLTDIYNYTEYLVEDTANITADSGSGINFLVLNTSTNTRFDTVQSSIGVWYLTGDAYSGKAAYITDVVNSGTLYLVYTDSDAPQFDFSGGTWTLLRSESNEVSASYNDSKLLTNNFITLTMVNPSTSSYRLDYQIDIQI